MNKKYEPLKQVRENYRISWYRCPIDKNKLKELTKRSDLKGFFQGFGHILLVAATGLATYYFFNQAQWILFAVALFLHGTIYSFIGGHATHELSHGTVFKSKWLGNLFLRFMSLISWFNFHDYKISHTFHHMYTLHPRGDREVTLPIKPSLNIFFLIQLFTLNLTGGRMEPFSYPLFKVIWGTVKLAFTGKYHTEWLEAIYEDNPEARKKSINWARILVLFNAVIIAVSIIFKLWLLPVLITFAPFIANWLRYFAGSPMHAGLMDNVDDFRKCCRTIKLDPFSSFIYWRMNWHTEHHMFAAIPCYNLKKLYKAVASDMPKPRTLIGAWREMRQTWKKQKEDPNYQFDTPLPNEKGNRTQDPDEASLGDLDPTNP